MPRTAKPRKPYRRRLIDVPVMPELMQQFEMQVRTSLAVLRDSPTIEAFDAVAEIIDVVAVAMFQLKRPDLHGAFVIIQSGASAMIQIKGKFERTGKVYMNDIEFLPIVNAVNKVVDVLPKLSVTGLYQAMQAMKTLKQMEISSNEASTA